MDGTIAAATLGVSTAATKDELRRAFRARAKALHPDAGGDGSSDAFRALRAAFDLLMARAPEAKVSSAVLDRRSRFDVIGVAGVTVGGLKPPPSTLDRRDVARPVPARPVPVARRSPGGLGGRAIGSVAPVDAAGRSFDDHLAAALQSR
jgi:hypothetical protein